MRLKASKTKSGFRLDVGEYFEVNGRIFQVTGKSAAIGKETITQFNKQVQVMSLDESRSSYFVADAITRTEYEIPLEKINQKIDDDQLLIVVQPQPKRNYWKR